MTRRSCLGLPLLGVAACGRRAPEPRVVTSPESPAYDAALLAPWPEDQPETRRYTLAGGGEATLVVTRETYANSLRVRSEAGRRPRADEFPALSMRLTAGPEQTTAAVALAPVNGRPAGMPVKVAWARIDPAGTLYRSALFDESAIRMTGHSYRDGEGDQSLLARYPDEALSEDLLPLVVRGVVWPVFAPGQTRKLSVLIALSQAGGDLGPAHWELSTIGRGAAAERLTVPAGEWEVEEWRVAIGQRTRRFLVEKSGARRLVAFDLPDGRRAELAP